MLIWANITVIAAAVLIIAGIVFWAWLTGK